MVKQDRTLQRMVLRYFDDMSGIPQSFADIVEYCRGRLQTPCRPQVERVVNYQLSAAYLQHCEATVDDEPLYRITAKGIAQASRMVKRDELDPMIWEDPA